MELTGDVTDLPDVGRRWIVVGLRRLGMTPAAVRKATGYKRQHQEHWLKTFDATRDVQHAPGQGQRTDREDAVTRTRETLTRLCKDKHRDARTSRRLATHVEVGPRQTRRFLAQGDVSSGYGPVERTPMLTRANKEKRLKFARKRRDMPWRKVAITDSKYFPGEVTAHTAKKMMSWHPPGGRITVPTSKTSYMIHVYGAVTYFGAIILIEATGTTGKVSLYVYQSGVSKGERYRGVCAKEYMDIFDEMHKRLDALFRQHGIEDWVYQQDGASSHTAKATKAHVLEKMGNNPARFMDDWPPNSPDLSWIENIWAIVEDKLWDKYQWSSLAEFRDCLHRAWGEVTSDGAFMRKMSNGMRNRMLKVIENGGDKIPM